MKTVFKIAKTELRTLFYSPIAWFLLIVFLVQVGLTYFSQLEGLLRIQEIGGGRADNVLHVLTYKVFASQRGVFGSVMEKLYFYIPLLSMGLISREMSSGTIRLLYSSPVKVWQIVLGKYVSMMVYSLLMVAGLAIFMIAGGVHIRMADAGLLAAAALGFYLLLCAYSAIGLFMSCLTTYQVVAAVATFITIGLLSMIGNLWQGIDFVRDITYFLSLQGRTEHMQHGLIGSKDVIYFCVIIYIFLGMSILKLKSGMESTTMAVKAVRYAFVIASGLCIGYVTSLPQLAVYYDATRNKTNTLTARSQQIIKELGDAPLEITAYNNLFGKYAFLGMPEQRNRLKDVWEPYMRFKPDVELHYVNYYDSSYDDADRYFEGDYKGKTLDQLASRVSKAGGYDLSMFLKPAEIRKRIDLKPELNRYVMQLKYKGRTTWLRVFDDQVLVPTETEVAAAFRRLQLARLPRIAFITGHLERAPYKSGDRDYKMTASEKTFRYALINQGFDTDTLNLAHQDIPAGITALVLADPKTALDSASLLKLHQYLDEGGNLLVAGEPGKQQMVNPVLSVLGVQLLDGTMVQPSVQFSPDLLQTTITPAAGTFTHALQQQLDDSLPVVMAGAAPISYNSNNGFTVMPLLVNKPGKTWLRKAPLVTDSAAVTYQPSLGDQQGTMPLAIGMERNINGRKQRIIVCGDADFMSNAELGRYNIKTANFYFNTALFSWLDNGEFPVDTYRPKDQDNHVNLRSEQLGVLRILLAWVVPGIILVFAAILLIRRKRK